MISMGLQSPRIEAIRLRTRNWHCASRFFILIATSYFNKGNQGQATGNSAKDDKRQATSDPAYQAPNEHRDGPSQAKDGLSDAHRAAACVNPRGIKCDTQPFDTQKVPQHAPKKAGDQKNPNAIESPIGDGRNATEQKRSDEGTVVIT